MTLYILLSISLTLVFSITDNCANKLPLLLSQSNAFQINENHFVLNNSNTNIRTNVEAGCLIQSSMTAKNKGRPNKTLIKYVKKKKSHVDCTTKHISTLMTKTYEFEIVSV